MTSSVTFRQDLWFEHSIYFGNFSRKGLSFVDDAFRSLKGKLLHSQGTVPEDSISVLKEEARKDVVNHVRDTRDIEFKKYGDKDINEDEYAYYADCWAQCLSLPQTLSKYYGKNNSLWKSGVYSKLYKFIIRDTDEDFEEDREMPLLQIDKENHPIFFVGLQRNREVRNLLKRSNFINTEWSTHDIFVNDCMLPFFACQEMSDRCSQFQAENELACALRNILETHTQFFDYTSNRFVIGMTCVGAVINVYAMRAFGVEQQASQEDSVCYPMQPISTFNLSVIEDILNLGKLLHAIRRYGEDIVDEAINKLRGEIAGSPTDTDSEATSAHTSPKRPRPNDIGTANPSKKQRLEEFRYKTPTETHPLP